MKNTLLKLFLILLFFGSFLDAKAQILTNTQVQSQINGQNPFMDLSTNFDMSVDPTSNGKGLLFPRTDLTQWVFIVDQLDGINFPTAFDGMIVYNTGTGSTLLEQGIQANVTPGFYYFYNPDGQINNSISAGQWLRVGSSTISDDISTATPVYPTWVSANSGGLSAKVSSTKFFFVPSTGALTTGSFVKIDGTSTQFLKADGSVDGNTYATTGSLDSYLPLAGGTLTGGISGTTGTFSGVVTVPTATAGTNTTQVATTAFVTTAINGIPTTVSNTVDNVANTISTTVNNATGSEVIVPNIYSTNGSLAGDRVVSLLDKTLTFRGTSVNSFLVETNAFFPLFSADLFNGRIGFGTAAPLSRWSFLGSVGQTTSALTDLGTRDANLALNVAAGVVNGGASITFGSINAANSGSIGWAAIKALLVDTAGGGTGDLAFSTRNSGADIALTERMRITSTGGIKIASLTGGGTQMVVADTFGLLSKQAIPTGTVTSVSVTTANGVSGTVTNATTTPAISLTLGAITPSSVASSGAISGMTGTFSGGGSFLGVVTAPTATAGTNTTQVATTAFVNTAIAAAPSNDWSRTGNGGTVSTTNFIGTTDAIDFVTRTNNLERMRIASNGNIGIGTSTPTTPLHIQKTSAGAEVVGLMLQNVSNVANAGIALDFDSTGNGVGVRSSQIASVNNNVNQTNLVFRTSNGDIPNERMRISSNGNIGIGTSAPTTPLHVLNTSVGAETVGLMLQNASNVAGAGVALDFDSTGNGVGVRSSQIASVNSNVNQTNLVFRTSNADLPTEQMRIAANGNIGIGIASPTQKLHVSGNVLASSFIKSGGTSAQFLKADGNVDSNTYATTGSLGSYLQLAGGTMTGTLNMGSQAINNAGNVQAQTFQLTGGSTYGLGSIFADTNWGMLFRPLNTSPISFRNSADTLNLLKISDSGAVNVSSLSGTGTQMVVADINGLLSKQAIPSGTVTSVTVTTANGVSGTVSNATTTPAISLTLGAITPTSVVSTGGISGTTGTFSGVVTAPTATAGTNTTQIATTAFVNTAIAAAPGDDLGDHTATATLDMAGHYITKIGANLSGSVTPAVSDGSSYGLFVGVNKSAGQNEVNFINLNQSLGGGFVFDKKLTPTTSSELFRINGNGNVGIGSIAPLAKLTVGADFAPASSTVFSTSFRTNAGTLPTTLASEVSLASFGYDAGGNNSSLSIRAYRTATAAGWTNTSIGLGMDVDTTVRAGGATLWLSGNGNVGIGTATPEYNLDVSGTTRTLSGFISSGLEGPNGGQARFIAGDYGLIHRNDGTNYYMLITDSADQYGAFNALRPFSIDLANGDVNIGFSKLNVKHNGNVGINTTTPTEQLDVVGNVKATSFIVSGGTAAQFLKANGTVDSNTYATTGSLGSYLQLAGGTMTGTLNMGNQYITRIGNNLNGSVTPAVSDASSYGLFVGVNKTTGQNEVNFINLNQSLAGGFVFDKKLTPTTSSELFRIDGSGNIGIGTSTPTTPLHIRKTSAGAEVVGLMLQNASNTANTGVTLDFDSTGNGVGVRTSQITSVNSGISQTNLAFRTSNGVSPSEKMRIAYNGNVGIGTAVPGYTLDVSGTTRTLSGFISGGLEGPNGGQARFIAGNYGLIHRNDGTNYYMLMTNSADQYGAFNALRPFSIDLANGDVNIGFSKLNVKHNGNVGINTATPTEQLDVVGNVKATSFIVSGGTAAQFLKANGTVDSATYATTGSLGSYLQLAGGTMTGALNMGSQAINNAGNVNAQTFQLTGGSTYGLGSIFADVNWGMLFRPLNTSPISFRNSADTLNLLKISDSGAVNVSSLSGTGTQMVVADINGLLSKQAIPSGTVTSVTVTTANGVSGTVSNATTTPAISLTLGAITPTSVTATGNVKGQSLQVTGNGTFGVGSIYADTNWGMLFRPLNTSPISFVNSTNTLELLRIDGTNGNVVIGTGAANSKLTVAGSYNNLSSTAYSTNVSIDFSLSNLAYNSFSFGGTATTINVTGIQDGGTYKLALTGNNSNIITFAQAGLTFKYINNSACVAGKETLYSFVRIGTKVYVNTFTNL